MNFHQTLTLILVLVSLLITPSELSKQKDNKKTNATNTAASNGTQSGSSNNKPETPPPEVTFDANKLAASGNKQLPDINQEDINTDAIASLCVSIFRACSGAIEQWLSDYMGIHVPIDIWQQVVYALEEPSEVLNLARSFKSSSASRNLNLASKNEDKKGNETSEEKTNTAVEDVIDEETLSSSNGNDDEGGDMLDPDKLILKLLSFMAKST